METTADLSALLERDTFDTDTYAAAREIAFSNPESLNRFLELLHQLEARAEQDANLAKTTALKIGLCYLPLGRPEEAAAWLEKAPASAERAFHLGRAKFDMRQYNDALRAFEEAAAQGHDRVACDCRRAVTFIVTGRADEARKIIDAMPGATDAADYHYARGRLLDHDGELDATIQAYENAIERNDHHAEAMFHLAFLLDLHGSDERARELYLRCSELPDVHVEALINLAVLHEDRNEFHRASACLRRILRVNPNHARARLYLKDVDAAREMYIDEQQLRAQEKRDAVLDIPVSDFELSVRSRNCLKKMNINTLGDLLNATEAELLAYKNFGETSLTEIQAMLAQKGLALGQNVGGARRTQNPAAPPAAAGAPEVLARSVSTLELSVRSRKCLQRLGINSIGELVQRSEAELLGSRNFGQTSLNEIKEQLTDINLTLRD